MSPAAAPSSSTTSLNAWAKLANSVGDLQSDGIDDERHLPAFQRLEPLLLVTTGIVARRDRPLQTARQTPADLLRHPWLDCYVPARMDADERGP